MSTIQVANVHLESSSNNRIQYAGSNTVEMYADGTKILSSNSSGAYYTGTINAASYTVGTSFIANTTGVYHTGTINAASIYLNGTALGNAATYNIGTTGATVPSLASGATFGGAISTSSGSVTSASSMVAENGNFSVYKTSAPSGSWIFEGTAGDSTIISYPIRAYSNNSASVQTEFVRVTVTSLDYTDATEDAIFQITTMLGGTFSTRFQLAGGLWLGSPTGGDKGNGTLNASAVYDDGTLLTCIYLQPQYISAKEIDVQFWDNLVPDIEHPAEYDEREITELTPIWDENGNGIDAKEKPVYETKLVTKKQLIQTDDGLVETEIEVEEQVPVMEKYVRVEAYTEKRIHEMARIALDMDAKGFDPRDPDNYFAKLEADAALPGMPTREQWAQNDLSTGQMVNRLWLAIEALSLTVRTMNQEIKELKSTIANMNHG